MAFRNPNMAGELRRRQAEAMQRAYGGMMGSIGGRGGTGMIAGQMGASRGGGGAGRNVGGGGLADQFKQMQDAANAANEARFAALLSELRGSRSRAMSELGGFEKQAMADAEEQGGFRLANIGQDLVNRGVSGTTVGMGAKALAERETAAERRRIGSTAAQMRANVDLGASQNIAQAIENRTDQGPDYNQLIALMQAQGAAGAGMPQMQFPTGGGGGGGGSMAQMMQLLQMMRQRQAGQGGQGGQQMGGGAVMMPMFQRPGNRFISPVLLERLLAKKRKGKSGGLGLNRPFVDPLADIPAPGAVNL